MSRGTRASYLCGASKKLQTKWRTLYSWLGVLSMPAAGPALWPLLQTQSKRFDIVYVLLSIRALQITGRRGNLLVLRKVSLHIPLLSLKLAVSFKYKSHSMRETFPFVNFKKISEYTLYFPPIWNSKITSSNKHTNIHQKWRELCIRDVNSNPY